MLKNSTPRRIDMTLLKTDGSIRVNDSGPFWHEEDLDWRYNLCRPFEENERDLLMLVYGEPAVNYSVSSKLSAYLEDRKAIATKVAAFLPIIKAISEADISVHVKNELLRTINSELHRLYPYHQ